jgi:NAD(P)H-nitrite reductase large subunit
VTMISADDGIPYDRPALSKDFLERQINGESLPLRSIDFYREHAITLLLNNRVVAIDARNVRNRCRIT